MLEGVEEFCKAHEHTIAALEAISTFGVVLVSLWLANRASRTRLTAYVTKKTIIDPSMNRSPEYLVAIITNKGMTPFYIPLSFLLWTHPYRKTKGWQINFPLDYWGTDSLVPQQKYPVELRPKESHMFIVSDIEQFRKVMRQSISGQSKSGRWFFRVVRITVQTTEGKSFRGKIDKEIRDELRQIQSKIGTMTPT